MFSKQMTFFITCYRQDVMGKIIPDTAVKYIF